MSRHYHSMGCGYESHGLITHNMGRARRITLGHAANCADDTIWLMLPLLSCVTRRGQAQAGGGEVVHVWDCRYIAVESRIPGLMYGFFCEKRKQRRVWVYMRTGDTEGQVWKNSKILKVWGLLSTQVRKEMGQESIRKTSPSQIEINSTTGHYVALIINLG